MKLQLGMLHILTIIAETIEIYVIMTKGKKNTMSKMFLGVLIASMLWSVSQLTIFLAEGNLQLIIAYLIGNIGICFIGTFWVNFALEYRKKTSPFFTFTTFAISGFFTLTMLTNRYHHLYYSFFGDGRKLYGILFYVNKYYAYFCVVMGMVFIMYRCTDKKEHVLQMLLLAVAFFPFGLNLLEHYEIIEADYTLTPLGFSVGCLMIFIAIDHYDFLDIDKQILKEVVEKYGTVLSPKPEAYEDIQGDIVFKDVSFSYLPGQEIIHTLNLHIEKGKSLAIVGETGSGKTTIANLLCRFYEPTSGKVEIDGVEYRKRSLGWLRSHIGYVQQTPFLFNVSIKENIAYGRKDASMEEIIAAAKLVGMHDFIMRQKDGYDTLIKDEGGSLSQGQKQLISFARAIVRNPSILILDEATSSIDTKTEGEVQAALSKLLKGRTSIIIAHRLSTISGADRILVLDKGVIVEDGNHKTLMEQKGRYYSLYMNQFKELSLDAQIKTYDSQIEGKGIKLGK